MKKFKVVFNKIQGYRLNSLFRYNFFSKTPQLAALLFKKTFLGEIFDNLELVKRNH